MRSCINQMQFAPEEEQKQKEQKEKKPEEKD
jgi:hypothetical protein